MSKTAAGIRTTVAPGRKLRTTPVGKIHPVVIYPFKQPGDYADLRELYRLVARLDADRAKYARPITVMDRKTCFAMERDRRFARFRKHTVAAHSDILDVLCVDTCQMWYSGLGLAFERAKPEDVFWLIPGDFNYGTPVGREVLSRLHDLPEICLELRQDVCIGEIATDHNDPKRLIDTYGTFALMYNWFPTETREIRQFTERPRSEFFAIRHGFLRELLQQRWHAHEQTVVILLQAVFTDRRISRFAWATSQTCRKGANPWPRPCTRSNAPSASSPRCGGSATSPSPAGSNSIARSKPSRATCAARR